MEKTKNNSQPDDMAVISEMFGGNKEAYARIFNKYNNYILYLITKSTGGDNALAKDLMMEVFTKAFLNINSYKEDFTFNAWLTRIAKNHIVDYCRAQSRTMRGGEYKKISINEIHENDDKNSTIQVKSSSLTPEEQLINKENKSLVRRAIEMLDEDSRRIVNMRYFEDKSYEEISMEINIPLNTMKSILFKAKDKLAINIKYCENKSFDQIAKEVGISIRRIKGYFKSLQNEIKRNIELTNEQTMLQISEISEQNTEKTLEDWVINYLNCY